MHTHNLNDALLTQAVNAAFTQKADRVKVPVTFYAALVGGILAADAELEIRLDVTMGERAAGMMRGESALDIAVRETRQTAAKAVTEIARRVQQAADAQTELHALSAEVDALLNGAEEGTEDRQFYRLRASVRAIRDALTDHSRAGARVPDLNITDLIAVGAWAPISANADADGLRNTLTGKTPVSGLPAVLAIADTLSREAATAPVVWRDLTPADIAGMTTDHTIRHLLTKAAELRDEAVAVAGTDPTRAGTILTEVSRIEREAMEAAMSGITDAKLNRIESVTAVLGERAKHEIRK